MNEKTDYLEIAADYFKNSLFLPAAKCYANIAEEYEKAGNLKEAETIFLNIIECYNKEAEKKVNEKKYHEAAEVYLAAGELENRLNEEILSREYYQKAVQYFIKAAEKALKQNNFQDVGDYYKESALFLEEKLQDKSLSVKFYKNAIDNYQKIIDQSIELKDFKKAAQIIQFIGILYEKIENYEKAIEMDKKALDLALKRDFIQIITDCYFHIANCFLKLNKEAEQLKALETGKEYNIKIGNLKMNQKNYLEAAECFDNSISFLKEILNLSKDDVLLLREMRQLCACKADSYLKTAELNLKINELDRAAHFQRNAALCYRMMNEHKKAAELFLKAAKNFENLKNEKLSSINFRDAGFQYEIIDEHLIAADFLFKAGKLARIDDLPEISLECYRATLKNYESVGNKIKFEEILKEVEECLKLLAKNEEIEENFHISASYLFEIGNYYDFLGKLNKARIYYNDAINRFEKSVDLAIKDDQLTIASYSLSCFIILKLILHDIEGVELTLEKYRELLGYSKYFTFSEDIFNNYSSGDQDLSEIMEKYNYIIKHSDELEFLIMKLKEKIKN